VFANGAHGPVNLLVFLYGCLTELAVKMDEEIKPGKRDGFFRLRWADNG